MNKQQIARRFKRALESYDENATVQQEIAQTLASMIIETGGEQKQIRMLSEGNHDNFNKHLMVSHVELNGKTLGIVGYGNIAKEIIKVAQALGMKILVSTRTPREDVENIHLYLQTEI